MVIVFLTSVLLASVLLTAGMRRYALRRRLMDVPNARSSHTVPTPRGGGLAIVVTALAAVAAFRLLGGISGYAFVGLFLGGALVAGIGYLDDQGHVPARWRLLVHAAAAILAVASAGLLPPVPVFGMELYPGLAGSVIAAVLLVWAVNLYNFMDGIDGLAGLQAVTVCAAASFLLWFEGQTEWSLLTAVFSAASLGFLVWNWPPARIFMGDAGSGFLGFSLAGLALFTVAQTALPVWSWIILPGVFVVDATVTLLRRVLRRDRWYDAHRTHAYQHAAREVGSHLPVTLVTGIINLIWLLPLAWAAVLQPGWGPLLLAIAWFPLVLLALRFRAGLPE